MVGLKAMVDSNEVKNLIFDLVVSPSKEISIKDDELIDKISQDVKNYHPNYNCIITIDKHFI